MIRVLQILQLLFVFGLVALLTAGSAPKVHEWSEAAAVWWEMRKNGEVKASLDQDSAYEADNPRSDDPVPLLVHPGHLDVQKETFTSAPHVPVALLRFHPLSPIKPGADEAFYLKVNAFDTFANNRWSNRGERFLKEDADDGLEDGAVVLQPALPPRMIYGIYVPALLSDGLPLLASPVSIGLPAVIETDNGTLHLPWRVPSVRFQYAATSSPLIWPLPPETAVQAGTTAAVFRNLYDTPRNRMIREAIPDSVMRIPDLRERIDALLGHFRRHYQYARQTPAPEEPDPILRFLNGEREGDCTQFASVFALMLRAQNLPARVAVGYCGGEADVENRGITFFADDGHAWVEVFLKDVGWVIVDPTPPMLDYPPRAPQPVPGGSGERSAIFPDLARLLAAQNMARDDEAWKTKGSQRGFLAAMPIWIQMALVVSLLGLVVFAGLTIVNGVRQKKVHPLAPMLKRQKNARYLQFFFQVFARLGCPIKRGQTLEEYMEVLRGKNLIRDEFNDMVTYVYAVSYENKSREKETEQWFLTRLKAFLT